MSGAEITIKTTGLDLVARAFALLAARGGQMQSALDDIGDYMVSHSVEGRFRLGVDPNGRPWAALRPSTVRARAKRTRARLVRKNKDLKTASGLDQSAKPLTDTHRLRGSVVHHASNNRLVWGTNVEYAAIHQFGGTIRMAGSVRLRQVEAKTKDGRRYTATRFASKRHQKAEVRQVEIGSYTITIPARPFLGFSISDRAETLAIIRRHIAGLMGGDLD